MPSPRHFPQRRPALSFVADVGRHGRAVGAVAPLAQSDGAITRGETLIAIARYPAAHPVLARGMPGALQMLATAAPPPSARRSDPPSSCAAAIPRHGYDPHSRRHAGSGREIWPARNKAGEVWMMGLGWVVMWRSL